MEQITPEKIEKGFASEFAFMLTKGKEIFNNVKRRKDMEKTMKEVAKLIWDICKISPEHGNCVMDLIGEEAYQTVAKLKDLED